MDKINQTLNVLVTRPATQGHKLAKALTALPQVNEVSVEPLLMYQNGRDLKNIEDIVKASYRQLNPLIIFVSAQAVHTAFNQLSYAHWPPHASFFAVGKATRAAMEKFGVKNITSPKLETSEGLLALAELNDVSDKKILIVRGEGGRELLSEQLSSRGAQVSYAEVYKRAWNTLRSDYSDQWQQHHINCMVVTSVEMLNKLYDILKKDLTHWQNAYLIVVSDRVEQAAKTLGFNHLINSHGASDVAIINAINATFVSA